MFLLRKLKVLPTFLLLILLIPFNSDAQCACVWLDPLGVKQCILYPNCSSTNEALCASHASGTPALCTTGSDCVIYPGSTPGCAPVCQGNGACWYQGTTCQAVTICGIILPIGLIELKGERNEEHNFITWKTGFESNNAYFIVSRSTDAVNWVEQTRITGAGTSTNVLSYSVEDTEPEIEINYYKIVQVDFDGEAASYGPISIDNRKTPRVLLKTVNVLGQEVDDFATGFVFNCYDDGSTEKVLR